MAKKSKNQSSPVGRITVLRQLREKAGLTREQLITRLGNQVALRTFQRWETQGVEPVLTHANWMDLCDAFGVRWEELPRNLSDFVDESDDGCPTDEAL